MIYISNIEFSYCKRDVITSSVYCLGSRSTEPTGEMERELGWWWGRQVEYMERKGEREEKRVLRNWGLTLIVGLWGFCRTGQ